MVRAACIRSEAAESADVRQRNAAIPAQINLTFILPGDTDQMTCAAFICCPPILTKELG